MAVAEQRQDKRTVAAGVQSPPDAGRRRIRFAARRELRSPAEASQLGR
jgi:hypothetical protein